MPHPTDPALRRFLDAYEREPAVTMRVLRALPPDQLELRPHPRAQSARPTADEPWT